MTAWRATGSLWPPCRHLRGLYNMSRKYPFAILCLTVAGVLLSNCGKAKEAAGEGAEGPTPVTVEPAVLGAIDHMVTADAILFPINQANVTAKISAPVKRVLFNRGDHVRAGQLLLMSASAT